MLRKHHSNLCNTCADWPILTDRWAELLNDQWSIIFYNAVLTREKKELQVNLIITLSLGSMETDRVISEPCYNEAVYNRYIILEDHWSCSSPERLSHCKLMRFKLIENRPSLCMDTIDPRGMAKFDPGA